MKRHVDDSESFADAGPLFSARARADIGMTRAAGKAERVNAGWRDAALLAVHAHAQRCSRFMAEHVKLAIPDGADRRAVGQIMRKAATRGWIKADGAAPACSSNGSFKTVWKSTLCTQELTP